MWLETVQKGSTASLGGSLPPCSPLLKASQGSPFSEGPEKKKGHLLPWVAQGGDNHKPVPTHRGALSSSREGAVREFGSAQLACASQDTESPLVTSSSLLRWLTSYFSFSVLSQGPLTCCL